MLLVLQQPKMRWLKAVSTKKLSPKELKMLKKAGRNIILGENLWHFMRGISCHSHYSQYYYADGYWEMTLNHAKSVGPN